MRDCWVGFDLGGTKMLTQVFDPGFKVLGRERRKTKSGDSTSGLDRVVDAIKTAMNDAKVGPERLAGIGIGCPGVVDMDRGIFLNPPNLGWNDVNIRKRLEAEFGCPVAVLNDVDAGVYGEYRFGAAQGARCAIGLFPGTGVGGGCIYQGEVFRGSSGSCFEVGHVQVMPNGPLCGCGQRGCLETVGSRMAIAAEAARAAARGDAPHLLKDAGADLNSIRSGAIAEAIKEGDHAIEDITNKAAQHIGVAVAGLINVLSPDVVIMGGGLVEAMPEIFVDVVRKVARKRVMSAYRRTFNVVAAKLLDEAGVIGAAAWAEHVIAGKSLPGAKS
jgi:glucokinase